MNALFVANFRSNTGYAWNTIEAVFAGVARQLHAAGVRVHVSYAALHGDPDHQPMRGEPVTLLTADYLEAMRSRAALRSFLQLLRQYRIGLLYLTDQPSWSWRYAAFRLAGVRRIVVHDRTSGERRPRSRVVRLLKKLVHRVPWLAADRVIAVSDYVAGRLRHVNGMPRGRVVRVHNGIDLTPFEHPDPHHLAAVTGLPGSMPVVFFAGRAQKYKGVDVLIRAVRRVQEERDVALVCCGDGPDLAELVLLAHDLGLRNAIFLGRRDDVKQLLPGASIAVVPSVWAEAFGLAVVESMAAGVPVIASRTGGIPELLTDGESGILVPPGDDAALARAIAALLDDERARRRMAERGRTHAEGYFGIGRTVDEVARVLLGEAATIAPLAPTVERPPAPRDGAPLVRAP